MGISNTTAVRKSHGVPKNVERRLQDGSGAVLKLVANSRLNNQRIPVNWRGLNAGVALKYPGVSGIVPLLHGVRG